MSTTHSAATSLEKGTALSVQDRMTLSPGPNEVLIEVKAVALNPVDYYQRDFGFPPVSVYPAVLGGDVAGVVKALGDGVTDAPAPGSRVVALASSFFSNGSPDHGAFQKFVLAPAAGVSALPENITFEQGAMCPLAMWTALTAWTTVGIPMITRFSPEEKQAVLIWGASSSVGSFAVQSARSMGYIVYATASAKHHDYIKELGAHAAFDYKDSDVVQQIIDAVSRDGVKLHTAHAVVDGALQPVLDVLRDTKGDAHAKVAHSPMLREGHPTLDNTLIKFNEAPAEPGAIPKHMREIFTQLQTGLETGSIVPSPRAQIEEGGLGGINAALNILKGGVSATKIVVPI